MTCTIEVLLAFSIISLLLFWVGSHNISGRWKIICISRIGLDEVKGDPIAVNEQPLPLL